MTVADLFERLPAFNAILNGIAGLLLILGLYLIHTRRIDAHRRTMITAFVVSSVFLVTYVAHKIWKGGVHTPYHGTGLIKWLYVAMLGSHIVLAMTVPVFAIALIRLGTTARYAQHRRVARLGWPIWMYVSVTGVLIYFMLYHFNPAP
ncbi:MAG: DUF420 domain-containing protein [Phycisphaeraceae bacterium]